MSVTQAGHGGCRRVSAPLAMPIRASVTPAALTRARKEISRAKTIATTCLDYRPSFKLSSWEFAFAENAVDSRF